jgi:hypothetical protein
MRTNELPAGWDKQTIREIVDYYEAQTDEEAAAEHEAALEAQQQCSLPLRVRMNWASGGRWMTITLELSPEQEHRLQAGAARQDPQAVREILLQAVDSAVEGLLRTSVSRPKTSPLSVLLDEIAEQLRDAPALSDEAVSRAGIYADHP